MDCGHVETAHDKTIKERITSRIIKPFLEISRAFLNCVPKTLYCQESCQGVERMSGKVKTGDIIPSIRDPFHDNAMLRYKFAEIVPCHALGVLHRGYVICEAC